MKTFNLDELLYKIDDIPSSSKELIEKASSIDEVFNNSCLQTTSEAAYILRKSGFEVDYNSL